MKDNEMFKRLSRHMGHHVEVVGYGMQNEHVCISIECEDCNEVLYSVDKEEEDEYTCDVCGKELTEDTVHVINNDDKYYCEGCYPPHNAIDKAMYQKEAKE